MQDIKITSPSPPPSNIICLSKNERLAFHLYILFFLIILFVVTCILLYATCCFKTKKEIELRERDKKIRRMLYSCEICRDNIIKYYL